MTSQDISRRDVLTQGAQLTAAAGLLPLANTAFAKDAPEKLPNGVTPFRVDIPQARIDRIMARVRDVEWPDAPQVSDPWAYGASLAAMKDLVAYWGSKYDWRAREAEMNKLPQFKARIEDYDIHFVHVRGSGKNPQPIIISHGWPSTFIEFAKVIDPLAHPERYGGKVEDAFSVVVPSLPGYGFSSKPPKPIGTRTTARLYETLMGDVLGYRNYIAQGGDIGSFVTRSLGYEGKNCKAIHLNLFLAPGMPSTSPEEKAAEQNWARYSQKDGAYMHVQNTKPLTIAYAMSDSPVGHAAWIFEKVQSLSGLKNGDPWSVYTRDEVLDNIMLFVINNTYATSAWFYASGREEAPEPAHGRLEKPVGYAHFPQDIDQWPRSAAERLFNIVRWTEMPAGGHFAAAEVPQLFVDEIRAFSRQIRA